MRHLVLTLVGLVLSAAAAAAQTTHVIEVYNFDFGRATGTHIDPVITAGDRVQWRWIHSFHSTTAAAGQAESWDSGIQNAGFVFERTFTNVGSFGYYCEPHGSDLGGGQVAGMSGRVIVQPIPEPTGVLLVAGLAGAAAWGWRRRGRLPARRSGATLIELLVVVAILAVFLGLLLPAVQRTRESASYVTCRNNLKQIGLALHTYESAHGHFPGPGVAPRQESVLAQLLPFLELDALRQRIDADRPLFIPVGDYGRLESAQAEAAGTVVRTFLCPSDGRSAVVTGYDFATLAGGNYVANAGTGTGTAYDFRYPTDGVFWYGSRLRHRDVTDGLSSTMFVAEALLGAGSDNIDPARVDRRRHWASVVCGQNMVWPAVGRPGTDPPLSDEACMMTSLGMTWRGDRAVSWVGGPGHRGLFNTYRMPNDPMIDCGTFGLGWFKASSNHPGGVNMVLGDGSVHFIKDHIDLETWRALSTRGDREVIGSYCGCK